MEDEELFCINKVFYTEKVMAFIGMNATGKTTILRLINLAAKVVIGNKDLNSMGLFHDDMIQDGTIMNVIFYHNDKYYQLKSTIGVRDKHGVLDGTQEYYYREEILRSKLKSSVTSKKSTFVFNEQDKSIKTLERTKLNSDIKAALKDDTSIVILATRDNDSSVLDLLATNYLNYSPMQGQTPVECI